ncbi:hypothetical protein AVEN_243197-1 [Araneus ventricosus]|uniref:Uncharacterized protein n=1 Tax=Araneus ventricosus TaxID=182803 RepID=A0A4Y2EY29_ARAVE|nr:hypothetical protein AVEN_243197-1 [Araneus ventricosus]
MEKEASTALKSLTNVAKNSGRKILKIEESFTRSRDLHQLHFLGRTPSDVEVIGIDISKAHGRAQIHLKNMIGTTSSN